jgi:hypothetical protein
LGEGLPLPWPFPWAYSCPLDWDGLQGHYLLSNDDDRGSLELQVGPVIRTGRNATRWVNVSRYAADGRLLGMGADLIPIEQTFIRVWLNPAQTSKAPRMSALFQMYYTRDVADVKECVAEELVPFLTLVPEGAPANTGTWYRATRMSAD